MKNTAKYKTGELNGELWCVKQNSGRHGEIGFKLLTVDKVKAFKNNFEGEIIPQKICKGCC